jgi:phage gp29-like protein
MQLIETSANTRDIYQAQIDAADMAAAIATLGQNLSSRVDGGSYAAAAAHERGELRRQRYVGKALGNCLYTQSLPWWAEYNFGDRKQAPFPRWNTEPPEDKGAKVQTLATLAQAIGALKQAGYTLTTKRIEEEYGVVLDQVPQPEMPGMPGAPGEAGPGATALGRPPPAPGVVGPGKAPPKALPKPSASMRADNDNAHGDLPAAFVEGQLYADLLVAKGTEQVSEGLESFTDKLIAAIDTAGSREEVINAVLAVYAAEQDPTQLAQLCENAMVMADLAGRLAVERERGES